MSIGGYAEAVASYAKAAYVRPDRIDIWQAKADLETRLLRFDDALKTNQKLYDFSYHDARYQVEEAALQARLGNRVEALRLLRAAYLDTSGKSASGYVSIMRRLVACHLFGEADQISKELRPQIADGSEWAGEAVDLEAQALTSLHKPEDAVAAVAEAWKKIPKLQNSGDPNRYAITIGTAAKTYLTPEEKDRLANLISAPVGLASPFKPYDLANAAGLYAIAALELEKGIQAKLGYSWTALQQLQSSRLAFAPLGHQLEILASSATESSEREQLLRAALAAYGYVGDVAAQLRIASASRKNPLLDPATYADLFVHSGNDLPARLSVLAKLNHACADAVVQYLLANGTPAETSSALKARGSLLDAPWTQSYTALTGLYFVSAEPSIGASFDAVLGPRTVEAELNSMRNSAAGVLRGPAWLYYAARYGDYLSYLNRSTGSELLPAYLESAPAASNSYVALGDTYLELHKRSEAIAMYRSALQLSPERAAIYDRLAMILTADGQKDEARESWRTAFRLLTKRVDEGPLDSDFWDTATQTLAHVNRAQDTEQLRADATAMIRAYLKRNGSYNVLPIFEGMLANAPDSSRAVDWIMQLARETDLRVPLSEAVNAPWLSKSQKETLYRFLINQAASRLANATGDAATPAADQLRQSQISYATYLLTENNSQEAWQTLAQIHPVDHRPPDLLLKVAALSGNLDELLSTYRSQPDTTPSGEQILGVASVLTGEKHPELAMRLKEFEYERELSQENAPVTAYLGLADVRLTQSRPAEALALLKTVTVVMGAPFENLPEAVRILEKAGQTSEAAQYARQWKTAEPWNSDAQLAFARLTRDASATKALCNSDAAPYVTRVESAKILRALGRPLAGSGELEVLTREAISSAEASQPLYVPARVFAAQISSSSDEKVKLLMDAVATDPTLREPRLDLAQAAFANRQFALGTAALDSYVSMSSGTQPASQEQIKLATVQESAARVAREHHDFARAVVLYDRILASIQNQSERTRITDLRNSVQNENRLATLNASRQPIITDEVSQSAIVKPKRTSLPDEGDVP